jgi:hypothetical protein
LNQPCPLCGGIRGMGAAMQGDFHKAISLNPIAIVAVLFIFCEVLFRVLLLSLSVNQRSWSLLVRIDIFTHVLLAVVFFCYICKFL